MFTIKKNLLLAFCLLLTVGMSAQEKFSFGAGVGFTKMTGDIAENGSGGFNYYVEGSAFLTSQFAVGVEGNFNIIGLKDLEDELSFYGAGLYMAKAEYYFMDGNFKPYAGLGLGLSKISTPEVTTLDVDGNEAVLFPEEKKWNLAISPRVGVAIGDFHANFVYNIAGKTPDIESALGNAEGATFNFWTISLGYRYILEN